MQKRYSHKDFLMTQQTQEPNYTANNIEVLEGLEAIRKRPGMYIGSTSSSGLHHLPEEAFANSIDEAMAGKCDEMVVVIAKDGETISIRDNGRGIPVGINDKYGISALELSVTKIHAGGKFSENGGYSKSGGLHGVGLKCINALSDAMTVEVWKDGGYYVQKYSRGAAITGVERIGDSRKHGTCITFHADNQIFHHGISFNEDVLVRRLRELAYLTPTMKIIFKSEKTNRSEEFYFPNGLQDYINHLNRARDKHYPTIPFHVEVITDAFEVAVAFQYAEDDNENILAFANSIYNPGGGYHVSGFKAALTRVINRFARSQNLIKEKDNNLASDVIREGLTAIVSVRLPNPEFEGQTKDKLGSSEAEGHVNSMFGEALNEYLEKNPLIGKTIVERAILATKRREAAKKASMEVKRQNPLDKMSRLPGKLADCRLNDVEKTELFLVEGDSAAGTSKQGRNKEFQAILPIRGKIINSEKSDLSSTFNNAEINALKVAIGCGVMQRDIENSFNINKLRYGKIIILTDADDDGSHIASLLLTFFFRYQEPLVAQGRIYLAVPPLYRVLSGTGKKQQIHYCWDDKEKDEMLEKLGNKNVQVTRFKGLGEMNGDELGATTMDPKTRRLIRVTIPRRDEADEMLSVLMGSNVSVRKSHIIEYFSRSTTEGNLFN